jgi:hypothetical protein
MALSSAFSVQKLRGLPAAIPEHSRKFFADRYKIPLQRSIAHHICAGRYRIQGDFR